VTIQRYKRLLRANPWVEVPCHKDVLHLLSEQKVSDTYYRRGSGEATEDLNIAESLHRDWVKDMVDLSEFPYCYVTNGATDAIHYWRLMHGKDWQKFEGEYEYPDMIGIEGRSMCDVEGQYMKNHRAALNASIDPNQTLYVSNPSSADGNIFSPNMDKWKSQPPVILDCTYVSSTSLKRIEVPSNTEQIFFSFSKGFGVVGQRIGLVYTKEPHSILHTLKEFENWNYGSVKTASLLMSNFKVDEMYNRHRDKQLSICEEYELTPSDCFYLATTYDDYYEKRRRMRWNDSARVCITPLFDHYI
jgi:hypothetical protein